MVFVVRSSHASLLSLGRIYISFMPFGESRDVLFQSYSFHFQICRDFTWHPSSLIRPMSCHPLLLHLTHFFPGSLPLAPSLLMRVTNLNLLRASPAQTSSSTRCWVRPNQVPGRSLECTSHLSYSHNVRRVLSSFKACILIAHDLSFQS